MGFTNEGTDLQLRLYHGAVHAFKQSDPGLTQVTDFATNVHAGSRRLQPARPGGERRRPR